LTAIPFADFPKNFSRRFFILHFSKTHCGMGILPMPRGLTVPQTWHRWFLPVFSFLFREGGKFGGGGERGFGDIVPALNDKTWTDLDTALQIRLKRAFVSLQIIRKVPGRMGSGKDI